MKWTNADVRSLAHYLAELNGGKVVLVAPTTITGGMVKAAVVAAVLVVVLSHFVGCAQL